MRAIRIVLVIGLGILYLGCSLGRSPSPYDGDSSRDVVFDGGRFSFCSDLSDVGDTTRVYLDDAVLGASDVHLIADSHNPFSSNPLRVFVFEPDSVSVRMISISDDAKQDYGTYFIKKGRYSLYFTGSELGAGVYLVELDYRGHAKRYKWRQLE